MFKGLSSWPPEDLKELKDTKELSQRTKEPTLHSLSNRPLSFGFSLGVSKMTVKETLSFAAQWSWRKVRQVNTHVTSVSHSIQREEGYAVESNSRSFSNITY